MSSLDRPDGFAFELLDPCLNSWIVQEPTGCVLFSACGPRIECRDLANTGHGSPIGMRDPQPAKFFFVRSQSQVFPLRAAILDDGFPGIGRRPFSAVRRI